MFLAQSPCRRVPILIQPTWKVHMRNTYLACCCETWKPVENCRGEMRKSVWATTLLLYTIFRNQTPGSRGVFITGFTLQIYKKLVIFAYNRDKHHPRICISAENSILSQTINAIFEKFEKFMSQKAQQIGTLINLLTTVISKLK